MKNCAGRMITSFSELNLGKYLYFSSEFDLFLCRAQCFCGNTAPSEDLKLEEAQCQDACSGDQSEICGGFWTINIYSISYDLTPLDVLVGPVQELVRRAEHRPPKPPPHSVA